MSGSQTLHSVGTLVFVIVGPILWALQLTVIYGAQSSLCAFDVGETGGGQNGLVVMLIVAASVVTIGLAVAAMLLPKPLLWIMGRRQAAPEVGVFLIWVMRGLGALSCLGMAYALVASLLLPACAQLR